MDVVQILITGLILCVAGFAQSAVGFGYALFATPLLLFYGLPLPSVITLVATCAMLQSAYGSWKLRDATPWKISLIAVSLRVLGTVAGLVILALLVDLSKEVIQVVVGAILCALVIAQSVCRPKPREGMSRGWAGAAFVASGVIGGICGMGGPPLVLWSMGQDWTSRQTRGFLFAVFSVSLPFQLALIGITFGPAILWNVLIGLALAPFVYVGSRLGIPVGDRIEKQSLQRIAYAILLVISISAVAPVVRLL